MTRASAHAYNIHSHMVNSSQRQKTTRKRHAHKQAKTYKHENKGTSVTAVLTCRQQNHFRHPCFCTHQNKLKTNKDDMVNPQTRGQGISMNMTKRERGKRKEERMPLMKRGAQFHALTPQKLQGQQKKKKTNKDATAIQKPLQYRNKVQTTTMVKGQLR